MKLRKFIEERVFAPLPLAMFFMVLSLSIILVAVILEDSLPLHRIAQAVFTAVLGLLTYWESRRRKRPQVDVESLKKALSFAAKSSRSPDPESIIVQGACRFPGVQASWLLAEVVGSRVEPLLLASSDDSVPPFEKIYETMKSGSQNGKWISFALPRWPGSPPYQIVLKLEQEFSKEKMEQMESYAQLAGGYLASGTALREYSVANHRLVELEKEMDLARQRLIQESRNSLMGKLVSNIAHELNNPLAAVLGSAQLLRTMDSDPKVRDILEQLLAETQRCKEIVDHVTGLAENSPAKESQIDMHQALLEVFNLLQYRLRRERIELQRSFSKENFFINGDMALMSQALLTLGNLMAEALSSTEEPRKLLLETHFDLGGFSIRLKSATPGQIAKTFFDRPATRLSLWVAGAIVEEYGGSLDASQFRSNPVQLHISFGSKKPSATLPTRIEIPSSKA